MKRNTGSGRWGKKTTLQVVVLAAVAVTGISFGRWIVPANASSDTSQRSAEETVVSAAATINERNYESGRLDSVLFGEEGTSSAGAASIVESAATHRMSPAAAIAQRKYDSGKLDTMLFPDDGPALTGSSAAPRQISAAESIALRKYESGRLDEILFGAD